MVGKQHPKRWTQHDGQELGLEKVTAHRTASSPDREVRSQALAGTSF